MTRGIRIAIIAGASLAVALMAAIVAVLIVPAGAKTPVAAPTTASPSPSATPTASPTPTPTPTPVFNKSQFSIDQASSLWVVVNKTRPLNPVNYAPPLTALNLPGGGQMRPEAAAGLQKMFADYQAQTGDHFTVVSPYRSYNTQVSTYNGWVTRLGKAQADRQSARPGYSEHQTGLAVDVDTAVSQSFGATPPGKWIAANSWQYGFIVRYPDGLEPVTGYEYEPWHLRFIGVDLATEMHTTGIQTLEQFFGLPDAPNYADDADH
ncbi:MAG: M15 family metallopeptidase [Actinomycetota bacterium]|nr:M15 family metallopeptidase [Actinomycetota bacterium]